MGYKEPTDYKNIHEFMEKYQDKINNGIIEDEFMIEACDYLLEMSTSDLRALTSQLERLYIHLLKYKHQPNKQSKSWINSIRDSRRELDLALDNKSLARKIDFDCKETVFEHALKTAISETHLSKKEFEGESFENDEFDLDNIRDSDYIEKYLIQYAYSVQAKRELDV